MNNAKFDAELLLLEKRNLLQLKLRKLNFSLDFIEQIVDTFIADCTLDEIANDDQIIKLLLAKINVNEREFIDEQKICALVGPTGVGKSTTLAKLAKRFVSRYGSEALGIISTDFQRIIAKNQFHYFGKLLNVQVEYAQDKIELQQAIELLKHKKLILIDTAGVNQHDNKKITALFADNNNHNPPIALYLVLPCNLQTDSLNEVVTNFTMANTAGCIITKQDECKTIAPCLSVILSHNLSIAYLCTGQSITKDLHVAHKASIINDILRYS